MDNENSLSDKSGEEKKRVSRVFALSDIHIDNNGNKPWFQKLSQQNYSSDALILAGDVSDDLNILKESLTSLREMFAQVFFVPGNHELWICRSECKDSIDKFWKIIDLCDTLDVKTSPAQVGGNSMGNHVWIVPLFSWYLKPEESDGSLYVEKEGEDPNLEMWCDNYYVKWPIWNDCHTAAEYFLRINEKHVKRKYNAPVISFSHFLPRQDLIFSDGKERKKIQVSLNDPHPAFNFSRVAGCRGLDSQIRDLGSTIHVYGHQHRNRHRLVDEVLYVSHCLGNPRERENRYLDGNMDGPKMIWEDN